MLEKVGYRKVVAKFVGVKVAIQETKILLFLTIILVIHSVDHAIPLLKVEIMTKFNKILTIYSVQFLEE